MRKLILTAILTLLTIAITQSAHANDIDVYNVTEQNYQVPGGTPNANTTLDIKFDLTWKNPIPPNSTDGNGASYWDRAWVFVKYIKSTDIGTNTYWKHATLSASGTAGTTLGPYSSSTGIGVALDDYTTGQPTTIANSNARGRGIFCKTGLNQVIRWNIGFDENFSSLANSNSTYKVRVFAIEMVLVPTGPFWAGDGNGTTVPSTAGFRQSSATPYTPWHITGENAIPITANGSVDETSYYYVGNGSTSEELTGSTFPNPIPPAPVGTITNGIPAAFPKGYNGFYIMKYELSQGSYCDFLNTLSRDQQSNTSGTARTALTLATTATNSSLIYAMYNSATLTNRNTIVCSTVTASVPIAFSTTTPHRACNNVCWADLCAYADWATLRPMTELEFEKACRGRLSATNTAAANVVPGEYAWGTIGITQATSITTGTDNFPNEKVDQVGDVTHGLCCYGNAANIQGPLRCGFAATSNTTRVSSGASYYGVMDLSGNMFERSITVGNPTGRLFDGAHGDGTLATDGNANGTTLQYWPGYVAGSQEVTITSATGSGYRGGDWQSGSPNERTSDRNTAAGVSASRSSSNSYYGYPGIRCVRTSP